MMSSRSLSFPFTEVGGMGLPSWFFGRRHRGRGVVVGDGAFQFRIVGTLQHQLALEDIGGARARGGFHRKCGALLTPQPGSPHDPHAIAVTIHNMEIGFLERMDARDFGRALRRAGFADAACEAEIVGSWERRRGNRGFVGVRLNAFLPLQIVSAEEWYGN